MKRLKTIIGLSRIPIVGARREEALKALSDKIQNDFAAFVSEVEKRLEKGAIEYGDESFDRPIEDLIGEIEQECLDLAGWGFVLWVRLRRVRERYSGNK